MVEQNGKDRLEPTRHLYVCLSPHLTEKRPFREGLLHFSHLNLTLTALLANLTDKKIGSQFNQADTATPSTDECRST